MILLQKNQSKKPERVGVELGRFEKSWSWVNVNNFIVQQQSKNLKIEQFEWKVNFMNM